jgi:hypothetical protein
MIDRLIGFIQGMRHGSAGQGTAWPGKAGARQGMRRGMAGLGKARLGKAGRGKE